MVAGFVLLAFAFAALGYALRRTYRIWSWTLLVPIWNGTLAWCVLKKM